MTPESFPHCRMKSSSCHAPKFKPIAAFVSTRALREWGCVIEDQRCFSWLRSAGRFVFLRWRCVRFLSPFLSPLLPHGLTMAQGATPAAITPGTMRGITPTIVIGL